MARKVPEHIAYRLAQKAKEADKKIKEAEKKAREAAAEAQGIYNYLKAWPHDKENLEGKNAQ